MNEIPRKKLWPYDEVKVSRDLKVPNRIVFTAPWLTVHLKIDQEQNQEVDLVLAKLASGALEPEDVEKVNWLFTAVAKYPFAYILPRAFTFGSDLHITTQTLDLSNPALLLSDLTQGSKNSAAISKIAQTSLSNDWTWEAEAALEFAQVPKGYDPESLFSISRRFHLLNDLEMNKTAELFAHMGSLERNSEQFLKDSALIARQNHYITQQCETVLKGALPIAQSAAENVQEFIQAESGHDRILEKALRSLNTEAANVPVLDCVLTLMDLFGAIAKRNLLGFSMVVDIFERTSYKDEDPFAKVLKEGGATQAADQIEVHREINDSGGHENVALSFLENMEPVDKNYALEALRFSELLTQVIHCMSRDTLIQIRGKA